MVQAIQHGVLPQTLHADEPTPHVDWSSGTIRLLTEARPWPETTQPRRAAVSAFGVSGTNAHLILEQSPTIPQTQHTTPDHPVPCLISAKTAAALRDQATNLKTFLEANPKARLIDIAHTLATGRTHLDQRAVVLAQDRASFAAGLNALAEGRSAGAVVRGVVKPGGKLAFLFTGQGSQHAGMGRELYARFPAFAGAFDAVCAELDKHLPSHALADIVLATSRGGLLDQTAFTQPALFAVEVALFRLLESWGVRPDLVAGHSIGELTAAHVADVLSLPDAANLVAARGRLIQALPSGGAMIAIEASEQEVRAALADQPRVVGIAAINAPTSVVISGDEEPTRRIAESFAASGRRTSRLRVSHAFHSHRMDGILTEFRSVLERLTFAAPAIPVVSNLTGKIATAGEIGTASYWADHARAPVRFADAVRTLRDTGVTRFLELGPDGILTAMAREVLGAEPTVLTPVLAPVLRRGRPEVATLLSALSEVHASGVRIDWGAVFGGEGSYQAHLPTYAFQRQRYWLDRSGVPGLSSPSTGQLAEAPAERSWIAPLADIPDTDRKAVLLDLVRSEASAVLGHATGEGIQPDTAFTELGLDSLSALDLRARLASATGLSLSGTLTIEHPTLAAVAEYLDAEFRSRTTEPSASPRESGALGSVYLKLCAAEQIAAATEVLMAAATLRPRFSSATRAEHAEPPVRLSTGDSELVLVCFPALTALSGPHEYARFGQAFGGERDVFAIQAPGFGADSGLPDTADTFVELQADVVAELVGDRRFALVGRSLGGCVAHAVTAALERRGVAPAGLAMIDTYPMDAARTPGLEWWMPALINGMLGMIDRFDMSLSETRLTAMGAYLSVFGPWQPTPISTRTLLLRADEPLPGMPGDQDWRAFWQLPHEVADIPGNHFSVLEDRSDTTAAAVGKWLRSLDQ
jgi:acyl transferase domain-containing protein